MHNSAMTPLKRNRLYAAFCMALFFTGMMAQTYSSCNPLQSTSCPPDTALGMTINVDFTKGEVNSFAKSGSPTYGSDGVEFTVAAGGDAPQLTSVFYIMFGRVEITMKAAPGAGIVSSLVLESDDLDEIDLEWLGAQPDQMQSNYFGKGQTTTYNRGEFHDVKGTQSHFITYTVDWTKDRIVWMADGTAVRTLKAADAEQGQYPQTPMQVKFGSWAGGDPNYNAGGTVKWAEGPTDYSKGPFTMTVQKIVVTDYSTGKKYTYSNTSGTWQSIKAEDGEVNGNIDNTDAITVTASAAGATATTFISIPVGGIGTATATSGGVGGDDNTTRMTGGAIPSGWYMTPDGKIKPEQKEGPASAVAPSVAAVLLSAVMGLLMVVLRA